MIKRLETRVNDEPEIFHSKILSRKAGHGIKVDVMYFPNTHKTRKARHGLNYIEDKQGDYALIITSGNTGPAFDAVARDENCNIQVVNLVNKDRTRKLINIKGIGRDIEGRQRYNITIRLPNRWFGPEKLEKFWKGVIQGKWRYWKYRRDKNFDKLMQLLDKLEAERSLDPFNAFAVTNIREMYPKEREYLRNGGSPLRGEATKRAVRKYDVIAKPFGSSELSSAFREERDDMGWFAKLLYGKPVLVAVTSCGNAVSDKFKPRRTLADKLDVFRVGKEHNINIAAADDKTYFFTAPNNAVISRSYKLMKKHKNLRTSYSGSICATIFDEECSEHTREGLIVKGTYRFAPHKIDFYEKVGDYQPLIIKPRSKVLIVNTGGLN